jgi:hypothetical protein
MALGGSSGIKQQISFVGDDEVRRAFERLGHAGSRAFDNINNAAGSVARASHRVELGIFKIGGELTRTTQKMH